MIRSVLRYIAAPLLGSLGSAVVRAALAERVASVVARRVARAEGWDPDASPLIEGQEPPASRPASPPPESRSRA